METLLQFSLCFHLLMTAAPFLPQLYPSSEHNPVICQPPAEEMPALICSANHSPVLTGMSFTLVMFSLSLHFWILDPNSYLFLKQEGF